MNHAIVRPAFPAHCIAIVFHCSESFSSLRISSITYTHPCAVAVHLPADPQALSGFQVKDPGEYIHTRFEYSSIIHPIIFGLVFTSGAGTSTQGPIYL